MAGQFETYRAEVMQFLHTCTIKFSPFSYIYGRNQILDHGYTDINQVWNPYYQNLCGEYQEYDTPMYIFSKADNAQILFSKQLKITHPQLAEYYRIPNNEYYQLCKTYPNQQGLIKSMVYPVADIQTVIAAPELSLLTYDSSLLYEGEQQNLLRALNHFLDYVRDRWWIKDFAYEDLYIHAFWYMLWQSLPMVLLSQRMRNIGTPFVHPFHVWEYLISKGLGDYREILTVKQSLWLYRNLRWILKNKGKNIALTTLAENILGDVSVTLYGKEMFQQTTEKAEECRTVPELISIDTVTGKLGEDNTSIAQLGLRLFQAGLDNDVSATYLDQQEVRYGQTRLNSLPTKYLELRKNNINSRWERLLTNFLVESTLYRYSKGQLSYTIPFSDSASGIVTDLSIGDTWALLCYALARQFGATPLEIPTQFSTYTAFAQEYPTKLPTSMTYMGHEYRLDRYIDVDAIMSAIPYSHTVFSDQRQFTSFLTEQFRAMLKDSRFVMGSGHDIQRRMMVCLYDHLLTKHTYTLPEPRISYGVWWDAHAELKPLLEHYDLDPTTWEGLAKSLITGLFPINTEMSSMIGMVAHVEKLYQALKNLFVQLCSYNVTFLDTARSTSLYFAISEMTSHLATTEVEVDWYAWRSDLRAHIATHTSGEIGAALGFGIHMEQTGVAVDNKPIVLGPNITQTTKSEGARALPVGVKITVSTHSRTP